MWDIPTKVANNGVTMAGKHKASEYNNHTLEIEKAVTHSGVVLTTYPVDPDATPDSNTTMLAESMSRMSSLGQFFTDSGAGNAYVLTGTTNVVMPKALLNGMRARWTPASTNTSRTPTANVAGLGAKTIVDWDGAALTLGLIAINTPTAMTYSQSTDKWVLDRELSYLITTAITITVGSSGADFTTLKAAHDSISGKIITNTGSVKFQLLSGATALPVGAGGLILAHANANKITIEGAASTPTLPSALSVTAQNNAGNKTAHRATFLANVPSRLTFAGGAGPLTLQGDYILKDVYFDATSGTGVALQINGNVTMQGIVAIATATTAGLRITNGSVSAATVLVSGCLGIGIEVGAASFSVADVAAVSNGSHGLLLLTQSQVSVSATSVGSGNVDDGINLFNTASLNLIGACNANWNARGVSVSNSSSFGTPAAVTATNNLTAGLDATLNANVTIAGTFTATSNTTYGASSSLGSVVSLQTVAINTHLHGLYAIGQAYISAQLATGTNTNAATAQRAAFIDIVNIVTASYIGTRSPAINADGNQNSYIYE